MYDVSQSRSSGAFAADMAGIAAVISEAVMAAHEQLVSVREETRSKPAAGTRSRLPLYCTVV